MSLINKFLPKKTKPEYFLTLGVGEHRIQATVAQITDKQITILGTGESDFSQGVDETEAADIAISTSEKNLPENILVEKVIFALPRTFIDENNQVFPEYLDRLKKITKELNLKPHGFVEYPDALSYHLEKIEGSPPTALLFFIGQQQLSISLVRVGKIQQNILINRTSQLTSDFESALPKFTSEVLPSRIILYDHEQNLDQVREELLRFSWHKYPIFLHTPKVEILETSKVLTSLVEAAGSSLIPELAKLAKFPEKKQVLTPKIEKIEQPVQPNQDSFGFIKGTELPPEPKTPKSVKIPKFPSFPSIPKLTLPVVAIIGVILISIISIVAVYFFYPKASVSLVVYPNMHQQQIDVIFTTSAQKKDSEKNIIPAKTISEEVSGEKTIPTTGKTKIGEKAKGEVTIYNKTTDRKSFPKGTVIANGNLKFTLDEDVTVASASDTGEGMSFGKASTNITAVVVGPEGNLATGSIFTFKDFPENSYSAKNTASFTGGASREVTSVDRQDQAHLEKSLSEELVGKARQNLAQKLTSGEKLLDVSVEKIIVSKKFSANIGSEANELSLSLSLKINAISFKEEDLINLVTENLTSTPLGFSLDKRKTGMKVIESEVDKTGNIAAKAIITTYFLPEIETGKIKVRVAGKTFADTTTYLKTIENIGGVKIAYTNVLPFMEKRLPFAERNIEINVVSN